jgi:hypothetical protein
MKLIHRIPTKEPYSYVEIEEEVGEHTLPEWIAQRNGLLTDAFKPEKSGDCLPKKEYDECIDKVMMGKTIHVSQYERMDKAQQDGYQLIKRSQARIKRLIAKEEEIINDMGVENMSAMGE